MEATGTDVNVRAHTREVNVTNFIVFLVGTKRFDSEKAGDREVQRTMLELLNQLDGFMPNSDIKVQNTTPPQNVCFHSATC